MPISGCLPATAEGDTNSAPARDACREPGHDQDAVGERHMTDPLHTTKYESEASARDDDHIIVVPPEDRTIVVPPRRPDDYAVPLPGGGRLWVSHPLSV